MKKLLLLSLIFTALCSNPLSAKSFKTYSVERNGLSFRIDPRIELFNIIAMQFGHNGMSLHNLEYKRECLDAFKDFRNHPAPGILRETWTKGWAVDDPIFFLLHLDEDFKLQEGLHPDIIARGGGIEQLEKLARAMGEYATLSGFHHFFNETKASYFQQILDNTCYQFGELPLIPVMESYFGEKASAYTVILNLLGGYGNFGTSVPGPPGKELYAVIEPGGSLGRIPDYHPSPLLIDLILHEFTHGFVNDKLAPLQSRIDELAHLYSPLEKVMKAQGYHNWSSSFNEHLVRSLTTRLTTDLFGPAVSDHLYLQLLQARKFQYADSLIQLLKEYESQRKTFPRFKDYLPNLVESFSETVTLAKKENFPEHQDIPKPYEFSRDSTSVFILPTAEADSGEMIKLHDWVKNYRNMISPASRIVTDREALGMDLTGFDLLIFGTLSGNLFLNSLDTELPVKIRPEGIYTNKFIPGNNLQLVLSWINPTDPGRAMILYTGQRVQDIRDFNYSPVKDQYHYWVGKDLLTVDKGDYQLYFGKWIPPVQ
ncbi:DUF4932 domain-containing protein [Zeaxanthinibacter enoshimensis]|uniref:Uncharacterized protein DUF4932 n=1 Tax=Zeaxanthinibacter enoshimensis TaxID=392009 RepID=A0A4R6TRN4_9FLAO|nr:DUF4932 domain-containing protein [Zeaxanthinibacter enoshimensis]TDQ32987.1 uncharacterized protein DUF4932 [Zeaxanthinibacter enoshimensis]